MTHWALCLRRSHANALARLRELGGVHVGELGELVWARGTGAAGRNATSADDVLRCAPTGEYYDLIDGDRLRPRGRLLPTGRLPELSWMRLEEFLDVRLVGAKLPGEVSASARLTLAPCSQSRVGEELLLCGIDAFRRFLLQDPLHRVEQVRFVVNDLSSEVLARGKPLPSLPGERFVLTSRIATPVGTTWFPQVGTDVVRAWLGLPENTIALWRTDGSISEIVEAAFTRASRSAGRTL